MINRYNGHCAAIKKLKVLIEGCLRYLCVKSKAQDNISVREKIKYICNCPYLSTKTLERYIRK